MLAIRNLNQRRTRWRERFTTRRGIRRARGKRKLGRK